LNYFQITGSLLSILLESLQNATPNRAAAYAGIAAIVVVVIIALWLMFSKENKPQQPLNLLPPEVAAPAQVEAEPLVEPEPEAAPELVAPALEKATPAPVEVVAEPPIPALDHSDVEVKQRLLALEWRPGLAGLFMTEDMLRNFSVHVDNIAQGQLAKGHRLLQPLEQKFALADGETMQLDDNSFKRYTPYIQLLESVPPQQMIKLFNRYEPLLQQAYAEQGYPDQLFKNKLIAAIDMLLATPEVNYPLALVRPAVIYEFADPAIEQLPAAQKQMIRLGPDNQRRVKALLQQYRQLLQ
jgi:hypothetical protein